MSGNRPELIGAPSILAELSQRSASINLLFDNPSINKLVTQLQIAVEPIVKAAKIMQEKIAKAFGKVKDFFKQILVKYLPFKLPLFEIPRTQIQPSSGKASQLRNSYRSHSPPIYCVIK